MNLIIIISIVCFVGILYTLANRDSSSPSPPWPYYAKKPLSAVEQVLYFRLVKSLPNQIVLAQVGLSRLLGVKKGNNYAAWFNRINRMSVDFVICAKDSSILCVIELDDATHARQDRQAADAKKDKALADAGVRIVRVKANALPNDAAIRLLIEAPSVKQLEARS